jgi:hypothetical protein
MLGLTKKDVLYVGDKLGKGGNDYPVKAIGVDCLAVSRWQDTALIIQTILAVTSSRREPPTRLDRSDAVGRGVVRDGMRELTR